MGPVSSAIEWTQETWNPVVGCTHVSEGCEHCYAAREASGRLKTHPIYAGLAEGGRFTGEVRLLPERLDQPLRWRRPRVVFVNSMSDLFHDEVPDEFIEQVFVVMARTPWHTYQVLTKRPGRMASLLNRPDVGRTFIVNRAASELSDAGLAPFQGSHVPPWPLPNVWLGTSVENQRWADVRIPKLLDTPAAVRFLSCEPLLGPVTFEGLAGWPDAPALVDWVIVGGESGPKARPMHPNWARSLRDQCVAAGVDFFFKQWGEWGPLAGSGAKDPTPVGYWQDDFNALGLQQHVLYDPGDGGQIFVRGMTSGPREHQVRVGKKAAGRVLDGRTWDEMPDSKGDAA